MREANLFRQGQRLGSPGTGRSRRPSACEPSRVLRVNQGPTHARVDTVGAPSTKRMYFLLQSVEDSHQLVRLLLVVSLHIRHCLFKVRFARVDNCVRFEAQVPLYVELIGCRTSGCRSTAALTTSPSWGRSWDTVKPAVSSVIQRKLDGCPKRREILGGQHRVAQDVRF